MTDVRSFLGFTIYYQRFIHECAHVVRPLNRLILGENSTKKKSLLEWDNECQEAFSKLKCLCSDMPVLSYADYLRPFKLHTNASEIGLGLFCMKYRMMEWKGS